MVREQRHYRAQLIDDGGFDARLFVLYVSGIPAALIMSFCEAGISQQFILGFRILLTMNVIDIVLWTTTVRLSFFPFSHKLKAVPQDLNGIVSDFIAPCVIFFRAGSMLMRQDQVHIYDDDPLPPRPPRNPRDEQ